MNASRPGHARKLTVVGHLVTAGAAAAIVLATLLPSSQRVHSPAWCVVCGSLGGVDVLQNILLFLPLGVGLAMRGTRRGSALLGMFLLTATIESLQFVIPGRDPTLSDVLANSLGGAIGFLVGTNAGWLLWPPRTRARILAIAWLSLWLVVQGAAYYGGFPAATAPPYYGQIKHALGFRRPWPGDVVSVSLNGAAIRDGALTNSAELRSALNSRDGEWLDVVVVPRDPPRRLTSIVRIVDTNLDENLLLAQVGPDLVFGVRTASAAMRLRPRYFALRDVFAAAGDTIRLRARYSPDVVTLSAEGEGGTRASQFRLTPASAWRFVAPLETYADGSPRDTALDVAWIVVTWLPGVFWVFAARRGVRAPDAMSAERAR